MSEPYHGVSTDPTVPGVFGENTATSNGVLGISQGTDGVRGVSMSPEHAGVAGTNVNGGFGIFAESTGLDAVRAINHSPQHAAVIATNVNGGFGVVGESPDGIGVLGKGKTAGSFDGNVEVTGDLKVRGASLGPEQIQALGQQITSLQQQVATLHSQVTGLQSFVTNLSSQLTSLSSKEAADVQGIAVSLVTLAQRVSNLGG